MCIEPLYPQVCQHVPVFQNPTSPSPSPTSLSQMLISVASSLSFNMEDEVSIFHLILESRHFSLCLLNAMQFWVSSLIFITLTQVICQFITLPLFLSAGQTLWLCLVVIPMLSMSLLGPKSPDPDVMNISTGNSFSVYSQNQVPIPNYQFSTLKVRIRSSLTLTAFNMPFGATVWDLSSLSAFWHLPMGWRPWKTFKILIWIWSW